MTGTPVVFAGPSLDAAPPAAFVHLPPAAAGDLLALAEGPPRAVALIDGVFDAVAAVQHKEVLELLSRGFRVLGAASMGALRAAELHSFGMVGVGAVFAAYSAGRLTADDEVALLHAPPELGCRPLTEALVDVRATLAMSVRARVLVPDTARVVRARARQLFWRERTWSAILADCADAVDADELARLDAWLPAGRRSIKAEDASACLRAALRPWTPVFRPPPPRTVFFLALARARGVALQPTTCSNPSK